MQKELEDLKDQQLQEKTVKKEPQLQGAPHQEEILFQDRAPIEETKAGAITAAILWKGLKKLPCWEYWER